MRVSRDRLGLVSLICLSWCTRGLAVSLSQFQPIAGFSTSCAAAYNSPISGCTDADFASSNSCSGPCMSGLQARTADLANACAGTQVDPSSLIGLFFSGKGAQALCPNMQGSSGNNGGGVAFSESMTGAMTSPSTQSQTSSSTPATTSSSRTSSTASTVSESAAAITSTATAITQTPLVNPLPSSTVDSTKSASTTTAAVSSTTSSVSQSFGGNGSPFAIGAAPQTKGGVVLSLLVAASCVIFTFLS